MGPSVKCWCVFCKKKKKSSSVKLVICMSCSWCTCLKCTCYSAVVWCNHFVLTDEVFCSDVWQYSCQSVSSSASFCLGSLTMLWQHLDCSYLSASGSHPMGHLLLVRPLCSSTLVISTWQFVFCSHRPQVVHTKPTSETWLSVSSGISFFWVHVCEKWP